MGKKPVGHFSHSKTPFPLADVVKFTQFPNYGSFCIDLVILYHKFITDHLIDNLKPCLVHCVLPRAHDGLVARPGGEDVAADAEVVGVDGVKGEPELVEDAVSGWKRRKKSSFAVQIRGSLSSSDVNHVLHAHLSLAHSLTNTLAGSPHVVQVWLRRVRNATGSEISSPGSPHPRLCCVNGLSRCTGCGAPVIITSVP